MHVDHRDAEVARNRSHDVRILAVRIAEHSILVEPPAHHGSHQNGMSVFRARFSHEALQIGAIIRRRRVAVGLVLRFVVVPELDEDVIACMQRVDDALPASFRDESAGAAPVSRVILDTDAGGIEEILQHLAPPGLGTFLGELWSHRRIACEMNHDSL